MFDDVARIDTFIALTLPQKVNTCCMIALIFLRNNLLSFHS